MLLIREQRDRSCERCDAYGGLRLRIFPLRGSHRYHAKKRNKGITLLAPLLL
ncbi:MAG: hypothetical protein V7K83_24325 [Nostoc sp.]